MPTVCTSPLAHSLWVPTPYVYPCNTDPTLESRASPHVAMQRGTTTRYVHAPWYITRISCHTRITYVAASTSVSSHTHRAHLCWPTPLQKVSHFGMYLKYPTTGPVFPRMGTRSTPASCTANMELAQSRPSQPSCGIPSGHSGPPTPCQSLAWD